MKKHRIASTISLTAMIGLAGVGFTGSGAHAALAGEPLRGQSFTSGTPSVVLSTSDPRARGNGTPYLTLGSVGPVGSSFSTSPEPITITNKGSVTVTEVALRLTDEHSNSTFEREVWACFYSEGHLYFNEPLTTVESYGWVAFSDLTIAPRGTATYTAVFYAGPHETTGCGGPYTAYRAPVFGNFTGVYLMPLDYSGPAPSLGPNPVAASLTNPAERGAVTPTVTISYSTVGQCGDWAGSSGDFSHCHKGCDYDQQRSNGWPLWWFAPDFQSGQQSSLFAGASNDRGGQGDGDDSC
jgi:hypothetical protein